MRILFIHQYFKTPKEGGGIRSYHMCKALVSEGHSVEVITAHNKNNYYSTDIDGIKVHYLPVYYENKLGFIGRSFAFLKFLILTIIKALWIKNIDVSYASSSPLTIGVISIALKKIKGVPYIFEVMDLWPEAPIQMGFIKNRLLKWSLYKLERIIYKEAALVVAASPGMEIGIKKVSPTTTTFMIPNISDCNFFKPEDKRGDLLEKYKVKNKFVCCYTGAIGLSNKIEDLINIAIFFKHRNIDKIHFLVAGDGGELSKIKYLADQNKLNNITFTGHVSKDEIVEIYNISDVNLIFFNSQVILETNSPNKFFDGIAAGLPSIININGWIRDLCEGHHCGKYFNRQNPEQFFRIIEEFQENKQLLNEYSRNARKLAESKFDIKIIMGEFIRIFEIGRISRT